MGRMNSKKKIALVSTISILIILVCALIALLHIRASNAEAFDRQLDNPEELFQGIFNTGTGENDPVAILNGEEICIFFDNDNLNYDEKALTFSNNEKGEGESFNCYCIKPAGKNPGENDDPEKLETVYYLCKYDGVNSIILLNEENRECGRISFTVDKENWLGKRALNYYWVENDTVTFMYKRGNVPYRAGTSYLKSKYYTGTFLGD